MKDTYEPIEALFANDAESLIGHRYKNIILNATGQELHKFISNKKGL